MEDVKLGVVESQFADIIWQNAPMTTKELVKHCEQVLNWKRTTTYTVLKKLCDRGIFLTCDGVITVRITKDAFYAIQSEQFVDNAFAGSLPAFVAAFTSRKKLSAKEMEEIRRLLEEM